MVVAIDGPAASGKSTVAKLIAQSLGYTLVNSGQMYRAVTAKALAQDVVADSAAIVALATQTTWDLANGELLIDGQAPGANLHSDAVDQAVSAVSAIVELRTIINQAIRHLAQKHHLVVEGRDMGTVVFPETKCKFYIDASVEARAARRFQQGTSQLSLAEISQSLVERDQADSTKPVGALRRAADAVYIDTSVLTIKAVCETVLESIQGTIAKIQEHRTAMSTKPQKTASPSTTSQQDLLQEEYLRSLDELEAGQLVDGVVVALTSEQVFIDVGYKSEGKISLTEFTTPPKIGDKIQVVLVAMEGRHGDVVVSKRKADEKAIWRDLKVAFQDKVAVPGKIAKVVKGGYEIDLGHGAKAFNPISKIDLYRVEEPETLVGVDSFFIIERLFSDNRVNIIVSRRTWLEAEVSSKKEAFFASRAEGDAIEGTVKSFTSFGAFVDLGGFDGLLHINDMSWGHVTRPKDFVKKGEVLSLVISKIDKEHQKINLSLKNSLSNPWDTFNDRYQLEDQVPGTVTKLTDFGAFVELEPGIEGLVHISELSWTKRIKHPKEVVKVGDKLDVKILGFDLEAKKVSLGVKQVLTNPWETIDSQYPLGTRLTKVVRKITQTGAFIELEDGIDGFLHIDDVSWTKKPKAMSAFLTEGQEIEIMILQSDPEHHNVRVGIKQLEQDPWQSLKQTYPEGSMVSGEITNITDFGIFVRVLGNIEGLIPKSQLCDSRYASPDEEIKKFKVGDTIKAAVLEIQIGKQKLTLSLRELQRQVEQTDIAKYLQNDEEGAKSTATLADMLKKED